MARRGARFGDVALILAGTIAVVLPYFVFKTANYGGGTQGFRWLFWLTPFWLVLLIPIATRLKTTATRALGGGLLGLSVCSALFVQHSPWGQSPVHLLFNWIGIVDY
jgi:uncharacterized RDD family membrane protein YckC